MKAPPTATGPSTRAARLARGLLLAGCLAAGLVWLGIALSRLAYPYELEFMEGAMVEHVWRVLQGQPIYAEPHPDHVAFIYGPLFYYLSAIPAALFGLDFWALRLVSLLATLGSLVALFAFARRETGSRAAGLLAAGLFAATFPLSGYWFDIARVDSLFLAFFLWGAYLLRFRTTTGGALVAALVFVAAYHAKQSALLALLPLLPCAFLGGLRPAGTFLGTLILAGPGSVLLLDGLHDGWFVYFTLELPRQHPSDTFNWAGFWERDMLAPLGLALAFSLAWLFTEASLPWKRRLFHLALFAGMVGSSWASRLHAGGYHNVLLQAHALLALHAALGWSAWQASGGPKRPRHLAAFLSLALATSLYLLWGDFTEDRWTAVDTFRWGWLAGVGSAGLVVLFAVRQGASLALSLFLLAQLGALAYEPGRALPTAMDRVAAASLEARIRATEGAVYLPFHGWLTLRAGKNSSAHLQAVADIVRAHPSPVRKALREAMKEDLLQQRYALILLDGPRDWDKNLMERYERGPDFPFPPGAMYPLTGAEDVRPEFVYLPRVE